MSDIVDRLRREGSGWGLLEEAAVEIERSRRKCNLIEEGKLLVCKTHAENERLRQMYAISEGINQAKDGVIERLRGALQCIIALAGEEEGGWEQRMEQISVKAHAAFHSKPI